MILANEKETPHFSSVLRVLLHAVIMDHEGYIRSVVFPAGDDGFPSDGDPIYFVPAEEHSKDVQILLVDAGDICEPCHMLRFQ